MSAIIESIKAALCDIQLSRLQISHLVGGTIFRRLVGVAMGVFFNRIQEDIFNTINFQN